MEKDQKYVLGIDLGSASLGWATIALDDSSNPTGIIRTGVRIFDPAVSGDIEKGQDESNAVARRSARLIRRQLRRRAQRQSDLFRLLQKYGLLPEYQGSETDFSLQRHAILNLLDHQIAIVWANKQGFQSVVTNELPLYLLRKVALDEKLSEFELGRVIYHFSQRRGYRSNRKDSTEPFKPSGKETKSEQPGEVASGIHELEVAIAASGARTLGEYFASLDPHTQKVRRIWTSRKMFEAEFAMIWENQAPFFPELLTDNLRNEIRHLLFYQRPIRAQAHLIGKCELEPGERRAAWATLEAQEFRVLQKVNDLEIIKIGEVIGTPLTAEQRATVYELLQNCKEATFKKIADAFGLKHVGFNLQRGGEKKLKGNLTNALMSQVFADRWMKFSNSDKMQVVEDWRTIEQNESLVRRAIDHWRLDESGAKWLADHNAPPDYCSLSRKAIRKLLPLMLKGKRFKEAEKQVYGTRLTGGKVFDRIPPVRNVLTSLRNPAVERSLTELRKVVNSLIREHGKPSEVRIELARDLKKSRKDRVESVKQNRDREGQREAMKHQLLKELGGGFEHPSRADVEKALLWEECQGVCPYTGKHFPFSSLFGQNPPMQVEHIIPFSRIPDDSFQNKTLCAVEENQWKSNKTPYEAYGGDPQRYDEVLTRIKSWKKLNLGKIRRFELRTLEELEGFSSRQLNDTRYASKLACELIGSLYGGRDIPTNGGTRQVVYASTGMVTATLRKAWGLEAILREAAPSANGLTKGKPRSDHRHHAIDAITIALSRPKMIASLSRNNSLDYPWPQNGRFAPRIQNPWKDFVSSIRPHFEQMFVSHRPEHRLSGAMHDETNYGRPRKEGKKDIVHIRKPVQALSIGDIENIVDPVIREAVRAKAEKYGGDLKKWTPTEGSEDWPQLHTKTGKLVPIKRVRIKKVLSVEAIAKGERTRYVALSSNHHVAIYSQNDEHGKEKRWDSLPVSQYEAMERKRKKLPLIQKKYKESDDFSFKFSLMGGDTLLLHKSCNHKENICTPSVWRLRTIASNGQLSLVRINDARMKADIQKAGEWWSPMIDSLRKLEAIKVFVDSLGQIHNAGA